MKRNLRFIILLTILTQSGSGIGQNNKIPTWGDQGNGTFRNPVLKSDYSDPDVIRHGDDFKDKILSPIWQWNHNPVPGAWSLKARRGWLRLTAQPAAALSLARNTLTQKIWDSAGVVDVKMDTHLMKDGQRSGFAFMSGSDFGWIGIGQENGVRKIVWDKGEGPHLKRDTVWFRGVNSGDTGRVFYSLDGKHYIDAGVTFRLIFRFWKGSRISIFSYGPNGGSADFEYVRYRYGATSEALGL